MHVKMLASHNVFPSFFAFINSLLMPSDYCWSIQKHLMKINSTAVEKVRTAGVWSTQSPFLSLML